MSKSVVCYIFAIVVVVCSCLLTACSSKRKVVAAANQTTVIDTTSLPMLPAEVIYMLGMEWVAVGDSMSDKYHTTRAEQIRGQQINIEQYVDMRLKELYPEKVYSGYSHKIAQIYDQMIEEIQQSPTILSSIGAELPSGFVANTADGLLEQISGTYLSMEEMAEELRYFGKFDSLASANQWADRQLLDSLVNAEIEEENLLMAVMLRFGPKAFYRVMLSKARAERLAAFYYGKDTNSGKRGDAFKHIYVNTLLRSYTGRFMSWLVMDVYWEHAHPNAPCDRYMDMHNNIVGRSTHYERFVQTNLSQQPLWLQWAQNVHLFIEDTNNNSTYQHWSRETPQFIVVENEKRTSDSKYIYWNK